MACRGFWECLLKLFNFLLTISGIAMVGFGIYLLLEWKDDHHHTPSPDPSPPYPHDPHLVHLGRPMLALVSDAAFDYLPKAWFIYLFIVVGAVLFIISLCGCIGIVTRNGCCLSCYAFLLILLILVELGCAGFIFFDESWREVIPADKTGSFDKIYDFLSEHWDIARWVALGVVVLQPLVSLLAVIVRAANRPADYDSDDEYLVPRSNIRQPLINRPNDPATGVLVAGNHEQRASRNDAWSTRMREKYGLDTSEFTYNPSDPNRSQQATAAPNEERRGCTIL